MKFIRKVLIFISQLLYSPLYETRGTAAPVTLKMLVLQKVFGFNRKAYWPTHFSSLIGQPENIRIGIGTAPGLAPGCYIQGSGRIYIGDYTIVAPNVGIISANHDLRDISRHIADTVKIGDYCWLGMNSVVLPGVELGDFTVVAAGAVVTKPFPEGYCILAGNPAKSIKTLDPDTCVRHENQYKYYGYISARKFESFRRKNLNI